MKRAARLFLALCELCALCAASVTPSFAADLYKEGQYRSLVSDLKAYRVGDSLTVLVFENSSAAQTADTNARRKTDVGIGGTSVTRAAQISGNINNDFSNGAKTQRAGKLLAQITVNVVGLEENGSLRVAGEQLLEVNDEQQMIRLEGKVRPQDIASDNSVVSSRLADARIHYVGDGVLADGQKPGFISRVLTWLGL